MLTTYDEKAVDPDAFHGTANTTTEPPETQIASVAERSRLSRVLSIEWLGQTAASICWIASVFSYGISSTGDWLQLCAASAWLLANIASLVTSEQ